MSNVSQKLLEQRMCVPQAASGFYGHGCAFRVSLKLTLEVSSMIDPSKIGGSFEDVDSHTSHAAFVC